MTRTKICVLCKTRADRVEPAIGTFNGDDLCARHRDEEGHDERPNPAIEQPDVHGDVESALVGLGWKPKKAAAVVEAADPDGRETDIDTLLRKAIKMASETGGPRSRDAGPPGRSCMAREHGLACDKPLRRDNQSGFCNGHHYLRNKTTGGKKPAQVAPVGTALNLQITEPMLNAMFLAWPIGDRLACVQSWLNRTSTEAS
jgi:hypothetical protein